MPFLNDKKTFLAKQDKSKKGEMDEKIVPLLQHINRHSDYYTTSSCSGRVCLWKGTGKKNETIWLKVSHELIMEDFLDSDDKVGLIWLRLEPLILHVACKDLAAANTFLELMRRLYKKSCLLSIQNKIIVEVRGSEFMEMPLYQDGKKLFAGDREWLVELINEKLEKMWEGREKAERIVAGWL